MPAPGGTCSRGGGIQACTETDSLCGQTDRCKNITVTTSLLTVKNPMKLSEVKSCLQLAKFDAGFTTSIQEM